MTGIIARRKLRRIAQRRLGLRPELTFRDVVDSLLWRLDRWLAARRRGRAIQRESRTPTAESKTPGDTAWWM